MGFFIRKKSRLAYTKTPSPGGFPGIPLYAISLVRRITFFPVNGVQLGIRQMAVTGLRLSMEPEKKICLLGRVRGFSKKTPGSTGECRENPQGVGFFSTNFVEASLNKNPTLDFILFIVCNFKANPLKFSLGGGVFYRSEIEASLNKNPTPWGFSRHSPVAGTFFDRA